MFTISIIIHHFQEKLLLTPLTILNTPYCQPNEKTKKSTNKNISTPKKAKLLEETARITISSYECYEPFGKSVAVDLVNMNPHQRIIAQKIISDVLYYGKLGKLTENYHFST